MFKVIMIIDGTEYVYGIWTNRNKANEVAMEVRNEREVETYVKEENM